MFCSKCGKELPDDVKFCPDCGQQVGLTVSHNETQEKNKDVDLSIHKPKQEENKPSGCLIAILVIVVLFIFLLIVGSSGDNSTSSTSSKSSSCPSVADMEDAINKYKSVDIIGKISPKSNSVYIPTYAQNNMSVDDLRVLGFITACYSAHVRGNGLIWADIYNYNTGKRIAKYSDSYGFKMY